MKNIFRKRVFTGLTSGLVMGLASCASFEVEPPYVAPTDGMFSVAAAFETPLVGSAGDAADDPAIYVGDSGTGFIAGTDKQSGLHIYTLEGETRDFFALGTLNNVDLREGYMVNDAPHVVLVASNDDDRNITAMLYNPNTDMFLPEMTAKLSLPYEPYGVCLGQFGGDYHVGVTTKAGIFYQYALTFGPEGFAASKLRQFSTGGQTEGCVFDDRTQTVYIAEEAGGLYRYPADPKDGAEQTVIARPGQFGLMADLEGVTVYPESETGGYLLVSSQGNDSFVAFTLPDHHFKGQFEIVEGTVDRVSVTDGIDVTAKSTERFPKGFFVVQDNQNDENALEDQEQQNFKIVDWRDIEAGLK